MYKAGVEAVRVAGSRGDAMPDSRGRRLAAATSRFRCRACFAIVTWGRSGNIGQKGGNRTEQKEHPCMVSPLQVSPDPDPAADHLGSFRSPQRQRPHLAVAPAPTPPADEAAAAADLRRLESSVQWLVRQGKMARRETEPGTREEPRRLPRATPLPPVPGIPPVQTEGSGRKADL